MDFTPLAYLRQKVLWWAGVGAALSILSLGVHAQSSDQEVVQRAILSTVQILIINENVELQGTCSGTVLTKQGHILTNYHCVGRTSLQDKKDEGLEVGETVHPDGLVIISPTLDPRQAPVPTYVAQLVQGSPLLDVAIVKIVALFGENGESPLPSSTLPLVPIKLGNSDNPQPGDSIRAIGYPTLGGQTVTVSRGEISGFEDEDGDGNLDSFKTDTEISPGNSGGLVINANGEQIGIPTSINVDVTGKLGRVRMINVARSDIEKALALSGPDPRGPGPDSRNPRGPGPDNPGSGGTGRDSPNPRGLSRDQPRRPSPASNGTFGTIEFYGEMNGELYGPASSLPSGISVAFGAFTYSGMPPGARWGGVWTANGAELLDNANDYEWTEGSEGDTYIYVENEGSALADGEYALDLYIDGRVVSQGSFTVGDGPQPDSPFTFPGTTSNETVVLEGYVVDAYTGYGLPGATVVLLKPGIGYGQWEASGYDETMVEAYGLTDAEGRYQITPGVAKGQSYTIVSYLEGYNVQSYDHALSIDSDTPSFVTLQDFPLQSQY